MRRVTRNVTPTLIGLSLFSYAGVPAYRAVLKECAQSGTRDLVPRVKVLTSMVEVKHPGDS